MKRNDLLLQLRTVWDDDIRTWMWTLSCRLDRQKLTDFSLTLHKWVNSDYNSTWNQNWLFENCVHAACENVIWNDQLHAEVWTDKTKEKNSELNDADEEWQDTATIRIWADAEWVSDDRICFVRQMLTRSDELVSWQAAATVMRAEKKNMNMMLCDQCREEIAEWQKSQTETASEW